MTPVALYCKSYRTDVRRLVRLAQSVEKFNQDKLPFYVSVPETDLGLFRDHLQSFEVTLISDQDILAASPRISPAQVMDMPGHLSQQIIKSEFWRLNLSQSYVCLDSDARFIRPFHASDFITDDGTPYTMLDEAHDLMEEALRVGRLRVLEDFQREADLLQKRFNRQGRRYSFGPFPLVWHRDVWQSLEQHYLIPNQMSFADAIVQAPIESRWYGEALLSYQAVALRPCQALFKVYHYAWQYDADRRNGISDEALASLYCGVICQSSWERELDWPSEGGNMASRLGRRVRRWLKRI